MISIKIDGKSVDVEEDRSIIEVADKLGIPIPRFCYHPELTVAASCRMCLVEVTGSRGPVPACSTSVTNGMEIFTKSPTTKKAQQSVTEFLLINHPLDCPVCDQAGECELQDLILQHSKDRSAFREPKRQVPNPHLGPLIATEMNRCIHCSRCVRFGEEIAGMPEMGGISRGEDLKITNYLETALESEVSGNMIDICPVGALTSKPHRFGGRTWAFRSYSGWLGHDGFRSSVQWHVDRGELKRVVNRPDDHIGIGPWISDRDRFGYLGLKSDDRLIDCGFIRKKRYQKSSQAKSAQLLAELLPQVTRWGALIHPQSSIEDVMAIDATLKKAKSSAGMALLAQELPSDGWSYWEEVLGNNRPKIVLGSFATTEHPLPCLQLRQWADNNDGIVESWSLVSGDHLRISTAKKHHFSGKNAEQSRRWVQKRIKDLLGAYGPSSCDLIVTQNHMSHPWVPEWVDLLEPLVAQRCLWHQHPQWPGLQATPSVNDHAPDLLFVLHSEYQDWAQLRWAQNWIAQAKVLVVLGAFRDPAWESLNQDVLFFPCSQLAEQQAHYPQSRPYGPSICVSEQAILPPGQARPAAHWLQQLFEVPEISKEQMPYWAKADWVKSPPMTPTVAMQENPLWVIPHPLSLDPIVRRSIPLQQTPWASNKQGFWIGPGVLPDDAPEHGPILNVSDQYGSQVQAAYQLKTELPRGTIIYWSGTKQQQAPLGNSWVQVGVL